MMPAYECSTDEVAASLPAAGAPVMLIACGGTGGHVFPGIAIARALEREVPGIHLVFVGTQRGLESRLIPQQGWPLELLPSLSIKDRSGWSRMRAWASMPRALWSAFRMLRRLQPDAVLGIGGYASGPTVLMAAALGIPTALVEPNAIPGLTNRLLGKVVRRAFVGFADAQRWFPHGRSQYVGNPVRAEVLQIPLQLPVAEKICIFCFGGSQGAHRINQAVISMLPKLADWRDRIRFIHQAGVAEDIETMRATYARAGIEAQVFSFTDAMWECYAQSHLVIARSGASTVAELAVLGRPAILIPYPFAADDHQRANAQEMVRAGGAILLSDAECTGQRLSEEVRKLLEHADMRRQMGEAMRAHAHRDAAEKIAKGCAQWLRKER